MTTRIDHLESRQLVGREPDPDDRRGVRVHLTKKGVALVDRAIQARLAAAEASVDCLSRAERAAANAALRKILLTLQR
jgi:DNA-binding MarR family transcriptional regulator